MKIILPICLLLVTFWTFRVEAFDAVIETVPVQYEVVRIDSPETHRLILGELENSPEMYEIVFDAPFTLDLSIRAVPDEKATAPQFSGIIIRKKDTQGIEEIARLQSSDASWERVQDKDTGLYYLEGPQYNETLEAGTYNIEISTPVNLGKYILKVGQLDDDNGFFASLADVKMVYQFYGKSSWQMIFAPVVYYPLGIIALLILIAGTYCWQKREKKKVVVVPHLSK